MSHDNFVLVIALGRLIKASVMPHRGGGGVGGKKKCHQMSHRGGGVKKGSCNIWMALKGFGIPQNSTLTTR